MTVETRSFEVGGRPVFATALDAADLLSWPQIEGNPANTGLKISRKRWGEHGTMSYGSDAYATGESFYGIPDTGPGCLQAGMTAILQDGWSDGADRVLALKEQVVAEVAPPRQVRRRPRWAAEGDELDRDRVYGGQLDTAWRTTRRESAAGPQTVRLSVGIGASLDVTADSMFWRGAAALLLVDLLEDAGYRVEIDAVSVCEHDGRALTADTVHVKAAREPVRPDMLAAVLAHAGTYRAVVIPWRAAAPFRLNHGGTGSGVTFEDIPEWVGEYDIHISAGTLSKDAAIRAVRTALETIERGA